jgi:hypothetical protein
MSKNISLGSAAAGGNGDLLSTICVGFIHQCRCHACALRRIRDTNKAATQQFFRRKMHRRKLTLGKRMVPIHKKIRTLPAFDAILDEHIMMTHQETINEMSEMSDDDPAANDPNRVEE